MLKIVGRIKGTGEFRSGVLSTVYGIHPNGNRYQWINDSPIITVEYKDIVWPDGWGLEEPAPSKFNKKRFWSLLSSDDDRSIKEFLVSEYFSGARESEKEWRCGDISGREPSGQGSLVIFKSNGWCYERDGTGWSKGLLETITSPERTELTGETISEEDVFQFIKEHTGEDFSVKPSLKPNASYSKEDHRSYSFDAKKFAYLIDDSDCFYFNHGPKWGRIADQRLRLILKQDHDVEDDEMEGAIRHLMLSRQVFAVADIAGYNAGVHQDSKGRPFLVTETTNYVKPVRGAWPTIEALLTGMLRDEVPYFHSWMKWAYFALRDQSRAPGHFLVIMGPPGCGKTLTQEKIISPILGCGATNATDYLIGKTDFNADLLQSFHLMTSDGLAFKGFQERKMYTEKVKQLLVNSEQRLHAKYRNGLMVPFNCRLSCSLNESAIDSLPLRDKGMEDKLLLLKGWSHSNPPKPDDDRLRFEARLREELPAYVDFLVNTWQIPERIKEPSAERFGFRAYQNSDLVDQIAEVSREVQLAEILRAYFLSQGKAGIYVGLQSDLYEELGRSESKVYRRFSGLCKSPEAFGSILGELDKATKEGNPIFGVSVEKYKSNGVRKVKISVRREGFE